MKPSEDMRADSGWLVAGHLLGEGKALYFTNRHGGVSPPPFHSLNLSLREGDHPGNVIANRRLAAGRLGVEVRDLVFMRQTHGVRVCRVRKGDWETAPVVPDADGIYTTDTGLVLAALTADCLPIALGFKDPDGVAMLHAGWRGTLRDIVGEALGRISSALGVAAPEVRAVIGPGIGPCCYQVDEGRARLFVEKYGEESGVVVEEHGYRVDLGRANRMNLLRAGVKEENIHRVGGCTCCLNDYFSFRREGVTGRQGAFVFLLTKGREDDLGEENRR